MRFKLAAAQAASFIMESADYRAMKSEKNI
jgi:hypothetical protein